jgi:hypothetical protein
MATASSVGDLGSSLTSVIANALKAIGAGAGETAAGVSGFLSPILGPAAPAAGLAAGAEVKAGALALAAFDVGAWNIPTNQLAMVHKGELIMPAPEATAFRANLSAQAAGGGGPGGRGGDTHNHTWNINGAKSPQSTAREVARYMERNPSTRGHY